jgi:hypothetical protein
MYLQDLIFIDEGNPSFVDGLINYGKWKQAARVIQKVVKNQAIDFPYQPVDLLHQYFDKVPKVVPEEKALYELSLECQPRGVQQSLRRMTTIENLKNVKDLVESKARRFQKEVGFSVDVHCIYSCFNMFTV